MVAINYAYSCKEFLKFEQEDKNMLRFAASRMLGLRNMQIYKFLFYILTCILYRMLINCFV
jgi:hypothetical protein